jgi:adenylate kinase family enzyme
MASMNEGAGPTCVLELLGVAGAGKTTVLRALMGRLAGVLDGTRTARRRYWHRTLCSTLRYRCGLRHGDPRDLPRTWRAAKNLAYLDAFRRVVTDFPAPTCQAIMFDHGPLYRLGRLRPENGRPVVSSDSVSCWNAALRYWSARLDMVVLLSAPDTALIERVLARPNHHRIKDMAPAAAGRFVAADRRSLEQVLAHVRWHGRCRLLTFDTARSTVEEIVHRVLEQYGQIRRTRRSCLSSPLPL